MLTILLKYLLCKKRLPHYVLLFSGFSGCFRSSEKKESLELDFTHSSIFEAFSMKYTGNDTLFVREYYTHKKGNCPPGDYFQKLGSGDLKELSKLMNAVNLSKLDTLYPPLGPVDGIFYGMYFRKGTLSKTVYGQNSKELKLLFDYLNNRRKRLPLLPNNNAISFKSGPPIPDNVDKSNTLKFLPSTE